MNTEEFRKLLMEANSNALGDWVWRHQDAILAIMEKDPYRPDVGDERSYQICHYCEHERGTQTVDGIQTTDHEPDCPWSAFSG